MQILPRIATPKEDLILQKVQHIVTDDNDLLHMCIPTRSYFPCHFGEQFEDNETQPSTDQSVGTKVTVECRIFQCRRSFESLNSAWYRPVVGLWRVVHVGYPTSIEEPM